MQTHYGDDITARSKLYAIWDDGDDDTDEELARICKCSEATVNTYRQDYNRRAKHGLAEVIEEDLPVITYRGLIMWSMPVEGNMSCNEECDMYEMCQWWVHRRGFVACERLLEKERK